jgi:hypothetical protein
MVPLNCKGCPTGHGKSIRGDHPRRAPHTIIGRTASGNSRTAGLNRTRNGSTQPVANDWKPLYPIRSGDVPIIVEIEEAALLASSL